MSATSRSLASSGDWHRSPRVKKALNEDPPAARRFRGQRPEHLPNAINQHLGEVGWLRLTLKPSTDLLRSGLAADLLAELVADVIELRMGAQQKAFGPLAG
jgi:hypothetical protein